MGGGLEDGSATSDGHLLAAAREGDREAFACLIDRHKDRLVSYLTRMTGHGDRAEDLAHEAFLRLYERGGGYREQGKLEAYLMRIAVNLLRSEERREGRRRFLRSVFLSSNGHHSTPGPQARVLENELRRELQRAIASLPLRYRIPLVLRDVEGWSYRDIAELTDCREGTVKSRIHRGRRRLRDELTPYWLGGTH